MTPLERRAFVLGPVLEACCTFGELKDAQSVIKYIKVKLQPFCEQLHVAAIV